ncbi:hypothetical protein BGZ96_011071, partial [Linnemannia gamsii]
MSHSFVFDNKDDPVLRAIAQELHTSLNSHPATTANNNNNNTSFETDSSASTLHAYQFRLESFLTRPRTCTTLFPPRVQKSRYSQILVQERLVLLSAAADPSSSTSSTTDTVRKESQDVLIAGLEVLEYTLTPLLPSPSGDKHPHLQGEERIAYIAKVDTSGFWPLPGLETASLRGKSPAQALVKGYLRSVRATSRHGLSPSSPTSPSTNATATGITDTSSSDINSNSATVAAAGQMSALSITPTSTSISSPTLYRSRPQKTSLYIFARAQPQYLFAESAKNPQKRVLDDRGLVRWWKNTAASVYADCLDEASSLTTTTATQEQEHEGQGKKRKGERKKKGTKVQGWWHIPGIETERQAHNVIQSTTTTASSGTFQWTYGYPDKDSKELANALIPQFPDDPKSRMMQSPSCQGGFVNIRTFWELAAIGEESGAGKITGFFRIEEEADDGFEGEGEGEEEREAENGVMDVKEKAVTGTTAGYTKVINFLLDLDFSTLEDARKSTRTWRDRVAVWEQKSVEKEAEHALEAEAARRQGQQQGEGEKDNSKKENEETKGDMVVVARPLWIQKGTVEIFLRHASEALTLTTTTSAAVSPAETVPAPAASPVVVNTLGMGFIKRKAPTPTSFTTTGTATATATAPTVNVLGAGLIKRKVAPTSTSTTSAPSATPAPALSASPVVNVL